MKRNQHYVEAALACSIFILFSVGLSTTARAVPGQDPTVTYQENHVPVYHITVVARTIKAINYRTRGGTTKVDFRGTSLMPEAMGDAEVKTAQGTVRVDARMSHMQPASRFGPEYMTYVLWAISPEGRPVNLGEVLPEGNGNAKLFVTSNLQSFGLIVTAEPHFAVTRPSDVVVMENFITNDTNGTIEEVEAKYELLKRGQYTTNVNPTLLTPLRVDARTPLALNEAQNAIRIAQWAGAEQYAADTMNKAKLDLQNAEDLATNKNNWKEAITNAREAAQMAEDARVITERKIEAQDRAQERQTAADAKARAESESAAASQARAQAESAAKAQAEAEAQRESAEAQRRSAEAQRRSAEAQAQQAEQQAQQASQAAQQAQQQVNQAEVEKAALRTKIQQQLNAILETRDTARGLIVNISDVLFDSGKYTLKPGAREKLAKVSGILVSHPGLIMEVDGYTDSVGGDEYNQRLSEERAMSVRDYLGSQGVPANSISVKGFGKSNPVASNSNAQGRQQNRRVELVVAGDIIKAQMGAESSVSSQH